MFGDFDLPVRRLDEVFNGKASSNTRLSRRLRSEVNSFLEFAKRAEKQQ